MPTFTSSALRRTATVALFAALCSSAMAQTSTRPFKGQFQFTETVNFWPLAAQVLPFGSATTCMGIGTVTASGNASHMGKVTATWKDCSNLSGQYNPSGPNSFVFATAPSTAPSGHVLTLTAANGDLLYAIANGTLMAQASGPHLVGGNFMIIGGTGRFAGATGGGTLSGSEDISQVVSGFGKLDLDGTITY
jgi:hypothetical protein